MCVGCEHELTRDRVFLTREEAEAFVAAGPNLTDGGQQQAAPPAIRKEDDEADEKAEPPPKKQRSLPENLAEREINETPVSTPVDTDAAAANKRKPPSSKSRNKKSSMLKVYTDGSALSNGREGSKAGVGVWFGEEDERNISEPLEGPRQTNQRAELTAILRAVNVAPLHRDVHVYTDSMYSINCVTKWHQAWSRNNWYTSVGRPVENKDLVQEILAKLRERDEYRSITKFEWVKGHTGQNDGNSMADKLAVQGARMNRIQDTSDATCGGGPVNAPGRGNGRVLGLFHEKDG
jgi:ribonuclease HI